jgi:hypothetical protein
MCGVLGSARGRGGESVRGHEISKRLPDKRARQLSVIGTIFVLAMFLFIAWQAGMAQDSVALRVTGTVFGGVGFLIDIGNIFCTVSRLRGRVSSPIGVLPFIAYFYGALLFCKQWPLWVMFCAIGIGALFHYFCGWGIVHLYKMLRWICCGAFHESES